MPDLLLSATSAHSGASIVTAVTTDLVADVQRRHDLSPTATAAVGRLVSGAALFGAALAGRERISLRISGDGPIGSLAADAWLLDESTVGVRGYARNGHAEMPIDARGKFDVAGLIGDGLLQVTKSFEIGQPYVGVVPLHSGEIAEDLAVYLAKSEQIPSIVALGVLANPAGILAAGGVLVKMLPGASEADIVRLEERGGSLPPVTRLVADGADARELLLAIAGDEELRSQRTMNVRFACLCTQSKVEAALKGLGRVELERIADERNETEAICEFCRRRFVLTRAEVRDLVDRSNEL